MVRSQATTMKIRNKNGRIHAALSAFDTPVGALGSTTLLSPFTGFRIQINALDKYCLAFSGGGYSNVVPANAGTHTPRPFVFGMRQTPSSTIDYRWLWVPAFAGTTPEQSNRLMCRSMQFWHLFAEGGDGFSGKGRQYQRDHMVQALVLGLFFQEVAAENHA